MAVDPIILEIQANIDGINKQLGKLERNVRRSAQKSENAMDRAFNRMGQRIAAAFAVDRIVRFGAEVARIGQVAKGVRAAFNNLNQPGLLRNLRDATRGTVSDLELMQNAVNAANLGVPIEELGTLFQFAARRAAETGESVEFLTNSIVRGLGRKSPLILDNLGISAIRLKEALGGVSAEQVTVNELTEAFTGIIAEDMADAADIGVNQIERLKAAFENLKLAAGEASTGITDAVAGAAAANIEATTDVLETESIPIWQKFLGLFSAFSLTPDPYLLQLQARTKGERDFQDMLQETIDLINADRKKRAKDAMGEIKERKGILEALKEEKKLIDEKVDEATSEAEINRLLTRRAEILEEIKRLTDIEPPPLLDLDPNIFLADQKSALDQYVDNVRTAEDTVDDLMAEGFDAMVESNQMEIEENRKKNQAKLQNEAEFWRGAVQLGTEAIGLIIAAQTNSAQAEKDFGIFSALINTFVGITNALRQGPTPIALANSVLIAAKGFAQVNAIKNRPIPQAQNLYEGTEFVNSPSKGRSRDDVPANLHHGEAVIPATANKRLKGFAKAWIDGKEEQWLIQNHPIGAILSGKKDGKGKGSRFSVGFDDQRLLNQNRRTNKLLETIAKNTKTGRRAYRHG